MGKGMIIVLLIIVILLIATSFAVMNINGNFIFDIFKGYCADQDDTIIQENDQSYYELGETVFKHWFWNKVIDDKCLDDDWLMEGYCVGNKGIRKSVKCEKGCEDGKCVGSGTGGGGIIDDETGLRKALILNVPLLQDAKCFWLNKHENSPECSSYYKTGDFSISTNLACPKFYNPVYDSKGVFYPSACWAEQLGVKDYQYGYSSEILQFIKDMWHLTKGYSDNSFEVPNPNIEFSYSGSDKIKGVFLRSFLWRNISNYIRLDYNIETDEGIQQHTSIYKAETFAPVYGNNPKALLVFIMFDELYPENILLNWTNKYEKLMNDYVSKKQEVPNPIQYNITPIVISPPEDVNYCRIEGDSSECSFSDEEKQKIYDAAIDKTKYSDIDILIVSPTLIEGVGGYYTWWNNMEFIVAPLTPNKQYSSTDKQNGLNSLAAFQEMFGIISHEVLHAIGLHGDHFPMGYGTYFLDTVGQNVDPITGKERDSPEYCDFYGTSQEHYAVELPDNLKIYVGQEPSWLNKKESLSGPCLQALYANTWLKDYNQDGEYEIMYNNNLIGIELQRALGWVDIDGDGVTELIDPTPYGGYKEFEISKGGEIGPFSFQPIEEVIIEDCKFERIKLENGDEGLAPLECKEFNSDVVNLYKGVKYWWKPIEKEHGKILIAKLFESSSGNGRGIIANGGETTGGSEI